MIDKYILRFIGLLVCIFVPCLIYGQCYNGCNGVKQIVSRKTFDNKKTEWYLKHKYWKSNRQLNLYLHTNDSVLVYYNDSVIFNKRVVPGNVSFDEYIAYSVNAKREKGCFTVVLVESKKCIQFSRKPKYYFTNLYWLKNKEERWLVNYTNNRPTE